MASHPQYQTDSSGWQAERLVPSAVPWHKKRMIYEHVNRYTFACPFVEKKEVVDMACGTGYGCKIFSDAYAKKVVGIDISEDAIEYAKKNYPAPNIKYYKRDVTKTLLADRCADVVTSFETIEHIEDDRAFILEVRRILRPQGVLIMSTPNIEFSTSSNPYHVREYTLSQCKKLLQEFSTIKIFGQRKVNLKLFNFMKQFPLFSDFRPWEKVDIEELKNDTNYCYFIFVCSV